MTFDREGTPERGIVACRTKDDARAWGSTVDPDVLRLLCAEDPIGCTATLQADRSIELRS